MNAQPKTTSNSINGIEPKSTRTAYLKGWTSGQKDVNPYNRADYAAEWNAGRDDSFLAMYPPLPGIPDTESLNMLHDTAINEATANDQPNSEAAKIVTGKRLGKAARVEAPTSPDLDIPMAPEPKAGKKLGKAAPKTTKSRKPISELLPAVPMGIKKAVKVYGFNLDAFKTTVAHLYQDPTHQLVSSHNGYGLALDKSGPDHYLISRIVCRDCKTAFVQPIFTEQAPTPQDDLDLGCKCPNCGKTTPRSGIGLDVEALASYDRMAADRAGLDSRVEGVKAYVKPIAQ
jgi:hypothetical protein